MQISYYNRLEVKVYSRCFTHAFKHTEDIDTMGKIVIMWALISNYKIVYINNLILHCYVNVMCKCELVLNNNTLTLRFEVSNTLQPELESMVVVPLQVTYLFCIMFLVLPSASC